MRVQTNLCLVFYYLNFAIFLSTDFVAFYLSKSGPLMLFQDPCSLLGVHQR